MGLFLSLLLIVPIAGVAAVLIGGGTLRRARTIALAFSVADTILGIAELLRNAQQLILFDGLCDWPNNWDLTRPLSPSCAIPE